MSSVVVTLLATATVAPGPGASRAELMIYSYSSVAALVGFAWIVVRLRKIIGQAVVVLATVLMVYLLAKLAVEAVTGG